MPTNPGNRRRLDWIRSLEVIPDPGGWVSFLAVWLVLLVHVSLPLHPAGHLFSSSPALEISGHAWLLLGPPLALLLGLRNLLRGENPLALVTVPLAFFLTALTIIGVGIAVLSPAA